MSVRLPVSVILHVCVCVCVCVCVEGGLLPLFLSLSHTHTHTHARAHARARVCVCVCVCACIHMQFRVCRHRYPMILIYFGFLPDMVPMYAGADMCLCLFFHFFSFISPISLLHGYFHQAYVKQLQSFVVVVLHIVFLSSSNKESSWLISCLLKPNQIVFVVCCKL